MGHVSVIRLGRWKVVLTLAGIALLAVACGSGGGGPSGGASSPAATVAPATPQPTSVLCQDAAALRDSLDKLAHVSVGTGTVDEIKADLADVQAKLTTFAADARGEWQAQTTALTTALGKLRTAVNTLASQPSASAVGNVLGALGDVNTATRDLLAAVNTRCPSVTPSPGT